jgi:diguanylate cyclase (GGDEF)-like protein/PAS domain S-box-containing protein
MRMRLPFALGPVARVSLGLIALFVSLVLIGDMLLGLIPQRAEIEFEARQRVADNVAAQMAVLLESNDAGQLATRSLQQVMARNKALLSVALRAADGGILVQRGEHDRHWVIRETERSRLNHLQVSLLSSGKRWGQVEMAFSPAEPRGVLEWLREPAVLFYALLLAGGFGLCFLYLRRVMQYLDPSAAVPERVRAAFDTLTDGVLVLDPQGRIMLANRTFRELHPDGDGELQGRPVSELTWMPRHAGGDVPGLPWDHVLRGEPAVPNARLSIPQPDGRLVETVVRCSPVNDAGGRVRGCIVTFHDVTEVHEANDRLRQTLGDLERTREQINMQNEELRRLAMRDPMTGCLNRRAFFDTAADLVETALKGDANICCIMTDIDHFKGVNDLYGHSVGDQVIQVVARALAGSIRNTDILCRYGGEEFCILLPNTTLADACMIAERARTTIENGASDGIRSVQVRKITSSFGVTTLSEGAGNLQLLIDQADQALYISKDKGRNRVTVWSRDIRQ